MAKDQKVVLITGTSTGIGFEATFIFADNGYHVYATSRGIESKKGDALRKRIKDKGYKNITLLELDVTKQATIDAAFKTVYDTHGKVDILINNAGFGCTISVELATIVQVQRQFDVNVLGVVRTMKAVIPHMRKVRSGRIINISSIAGFTALPSWGFYSATKFAVEALTRSEAAVLKNFGIQALTFYPGPVYTPIAQKGGLEQKEYGQQDVPEDYKPLIASFGQSIGEMYQNHGITAEACAKELYKTAVQEEIKGTYYADSKYASEIVKAIVPHDPIGEHELNSNYAKLQLTKKEKTDEKQQKA